jgi:putative MATE family efflux protein
MEQLDTGEPEGKEREHAVDRLGAEKVGALLLRFSIPAITGMLVNALYNVVDRIFVGRGVNEIALGGLSLVMPLMTLALAFGMLAGMGAANLISMRLGQRRKADAETALAHCLVLLVVIGAALMVFGLVFLNPLLSFLAGGVESAITGYARSYFRIILFGSIFMQLGFGFGHCSRAQGFPMISMTGMLLGAGINIALDPLFIFVFHWGVEGAAWATILSQAVSAIFVLSFAASPRAAVRLKFRGFSWRPEVARSIFTFGFSQFLLQLTMSCAQFLLNIQIMRHGSGALGVANGGEIAIAGMNIVGSVSMLILMPVFGICQGAQPILGYNYGAKNYSRVFSALTKAAFAAFCITTVGFLAVQLFAPRIVMLFTPEGSAAMMTYTPFAMRIALLVLPLVGPQVVAANMFVVTGRPNTSIFLTMLRQAIVFIPCLLLFGRLWGLYGILGALPAADAAAVMVTGVFTGVELKKLRRQIREANR